MNKELVHRHHDAEVLLTNPHLTENAVSFGFRLNPSHRMSPPSGEDAPFVVMLEFARQLGIGASHLLGKVPQDLVAIAARLGFAWEGKPVPHALINSPRTKAIVRFLDLTALPDGTYVAELVSEIKYHRQKIASAWGTITWVRSRTYRRLRGRGLLNTTADTFCEPRFLADELHTSRWVQGILNWDCTNTFFFDHHSDHIPGMIFAAAALEAHLLLPKGGIPSSIDLHFRRYGELTAPVNSETELDNPRNPKGTLTTYTQNGQSICTVSIRSIHSADNS